MIQSQMPVEPKRILIQEMLGDLLDFAPAALEKQGGTGGVLKKNRTIA